MVLLRWLSSWFLISKRNIQVHPKDTLDLSTHSSCLKALNDGGYSPLTPPSSRARAWGECFHWPMGLKRYKNLTWQTKGRLDQCTDSPRARLTEGTRLLQRPPPLGIDMEAPVSSGTELDNETNQHRKLPLFFLTAVTSYRQVSVRMFCSILRYVFKNSAIYIYISPEEWAITKQACRDESVVYTHIYIYIYIQ